MITNPFANLGNSSNIFSVSTTMRRPIYSFEELKMIEYNQNFLVTICLFVDEASVPVFVARGMVVMQLAHQKAETAFLPRGQTF